MWTIGACISTRRRPNYLIIGDSHGGDRYAGLSALFPEVNFLQMTTASCRPLLDTDFMDYYCPERMEYVFRKFLPGARIDGVILVGRWQPKDLDRLRATLKHLRRLGHRVILVGPAVEIFPWVPNLMFHHGRREGLEEWVSRFIVPERLEMDRTLRAMGTEEGAEYFSAIDAMCPHLRCPGSEPGRQTFDRRLPALPEGPQVQLEGPGRARLAGEEEYRLGDVVRAGEEAIGGIRQHGARGRHVHHRVDNDVGDMDALRPQLAGQRLRQAALCGLGRTEGDKAGRALERGRRADGDDAPLARPRACPGSPAWPQGAGRRC